MPPEPTPRSYSGAREPASSPGRARSARRRETAASVGGRASLEALRWPRGNDSRRVGERMFILDLPTELAVQILSLLAPLDLLILSYVNKNYWLVLRSPSAEDVWRSARRNVGLPDRLPPDLTETAYARLLFVSLCEFCGRYAIDKAAAVQYRVRICNSCAKANTATGPEALAAGEEMQSIYCLSPTEYLALLPGLELSPDGRKHSFERTRYLWSHLHALHQKLRAYNREERDEFIQTRRDMMEAVRASWQPMLQWIEAMKRERRETQLQAMKTRVDEICRRLVDMGYHQSDVYVEEFMKHREINKAEPITDRVWERNSSKFQQILRDTKDERIRKQRRELNNPVLTTIFAELWTALGSDEEKYTFLPVKDFLDLPTVKTIAEEPLTPDEIQARFADAWPQIQPDIEQFHRQMRFSLARKLRGFRRPEQSEATSSSDANATDEDCIAFLRRAMSACTVGSMLGNQLIRDYHTMFKGDFFGGDEGGEHADSHPVLRHHWSHYLRAIEPLPHVMSAILDDVHLDQNTATFDELNVAMPDWRTKFWVYALDTEMLSDSDDDEQ